MSSSTRPMATFLGAAAACVAVREGARAFVGPSNAVAPEDFAVSTPALRGAPAEPATSSCSMPFSALSVAVAGATALKMTSRRRSKIQRNVGEEKRIKREEIAQTREEQESNILELFKLTEEPSIYTVRAALATLAKLCPRPNANIQGDWIIFWASREGCVDRVFGTGKTDVGWWYQMQEFLLRFGSKKEGKVCEAAEIIRRVGPFPNEANSLKGSYLTAGTTGLKIVFTEVKTVDGREIELQDGTFAKQKKIIKCDVIYSSEKMVALQAEDKKSGEFEFYILTPVENIRTEVNRLLGAERARFLFN